MSNENSQMPTTNGQNETKTHELKVSPLTVKIQYIKDFSFENPNPLESLKESSEGPEINLNLDIQVNAINQQDFEVVLHLKAEAKRTNAIMFIAELQYAGVFMLTNVPQEAMHPILMIECPRLLFPYARNIIATMTREGGFPTLSLAPVDFVELYRQQYIEPQQNSESTPPTTNS